MAFGRRGRNGDDPVHHYAEHERADDFGDLEAANREFASRFTLSGFDGVAHAGVAVVTCMDSRIDPLGMLGLSPGDAKIFRNPGGRVTQVRSHPLIPDSTKVGGYLYYVDSGLIERRF